LISSPKISENSNKYRLKNLISIAVGFLFIFSLSLSAQNKPVEQGFKEAAKKHMEAGRYGEAIDLLNKYISQNPQRADGYNLRGLSFEKRKEYQKAVLDFRRARKLAKKDELPKILENLNRTIKVWHAQLRKKIEGHEREIAIDPTKPVNYLEIGKSYRWLEEWDNAETWYDKYLAMDDNASPDEIIRYTEILTHTGHLVKGEKILKKYVERYPDDWRLWSRYGYFTLWLGKYKIAQHAFETALSFKPFFKEAQDGLDSAKRQAYVTEYDPRSFEREFPIDRYYRIVKKNPGDYETRFKLVDALIKAERMEEALQQLQKIGVNHSDDPRYQEKLDYVQNYRDQVYQQKIDYYQKKLDENPQDKTAVSKLAEYYSRLEDYDTAYQILNDYFDQVPDETDQKLRYQYAKVAAWARDFDKAIEIMDALLEDQPNNLDYQLFRAQISVWHNVDIDLAREYLNNVLEKEPNNVEALISMSSLNLIDKDYDAAQEKADKVRELDPSNDQLDVLQSRIDFEKMRFEEEQLYKILNEGRELVIDGNCEEALPFYEEYMSEAEPNSLIQKEYGDVQFCAGNYEDALTQYDDVLSQGYNYDAALNRGKVLYAMGDSLAAIESFRGLVEEEPEEFEPRLYLGDSYAKATYYDSARAVYDTLLTWDLDSTETAMVQQRIEWLPVKGINAILSTFPNYVGLSPSFNYYSDNLSFRYSNFGVRMELGIAQFLAFGVSYSKHNLYANRESLLDSILTIQSENGDYFTGRRTFTSFKGHIYLTMTEKFRAGAGFGTLNGPNADSTPERDMFIRYENKDVFMIGANYLNTDAAIVLYSPYLIDTRMRASYWGIDGYYQHKSGLRLQSHFDYIQVNDGNEGNNFWIRIGKHFLDYFKAGYEYWFINWGYDSPYYYSPSNFESHSFWFEADLEDSEEFKLYLDGKMGYIPQSDFVLLQGGIRGDYNPFERLTITGRLGAGTTSRDNSTYKFFSASLSAYWTVF